MSTTPEEMTFNEHVKAALAIASERRSESMSRQTRTATETEQASAAARDLSLSITALEDAATRYNSGRYHQMGKWMRADPDRPS